jgi:hypothetical protein
MDPSKKRLFYVSDDWKESTPVTISELQEGLVSGKHTVKTLAWTEGMTNWLPLSDPHWKKFDIGFPSSPPPLPQRKGCMDCGTTDPKLEFYKTEIDMVYAYEKVGGYLRDIGRIDCSDYLKFKKNQSNEIVSEVLEERRRRVDKMFGWDSEVTSKSNQTDQNLEVIEKPEDYDTVFEESLSYLMENYFTCSNCMRDHDLNEIESYARNEIYGMDKVEVEENIPTSDFFSKKSKENNKFRTKTGSKMTFAQGAAAGFIASQIRETKEAVNDIQEDVSDIQEDVSDIQEDVSDIQSEASDNPGADFSGFF